uniref:UDP-N-acetyl-alpha-D-muramoyl-L-alanyl-L-glutamate epimerase n=1 Tax=Thermosporothrix sp. COM3 TaxID=2490863 RepID=A0A455SI33_9CHLR|nr:hypothetical protein KTC_13130 [Thermosporothrix sp. COM3]
MPLLRLEAIQLTSDQIIIRHSLDARPFKTTIHYHDVQLDTLKKRYGARLIDAIAFHIAFFEGMKYCSLAPHIYDITPWTCTEETIALFKLLYQEIFAQHRWENGLAHYPGPTIVPDPAPSARMPHPIETHEPSLLVSCGGGKDSLAVMKLLERIGEPYAVTQYAHSCYGPTQPQHALIDEMVRCCSVARQHRFSLHDTFLHQPHVLEQFPGPVTTFCAPETPCSIFATLPILLNYGYTFLCLGHEQGADSENFFWEEEQRFVNHQWGKSLEAEHVLNRYIQRHLLSNLHVFSILKPIYDFLIFQLLRDEQQHIRTTHSCNITKPWCKRCPKCIYVWLSTLAYLRVNLFNENLFDQQEVQDTFFQLMGKSGHRPFECVGEVDETRLALYACLQQGYQGKILDIFRQEILPYIDIGALLSRYNTVFSEKHAIPPRLAEPVLLQFAAVRVNEQEFLKR